MTSTIEFRGAVHQNLYLAEGSREVHAVITVDAQGDLAATANTPAPEAAEVIILDCSGSMGSPPEKIVKAKQAAGVAIDGLRDGVRFALIAGSVGARMLWPARAELLPADAQTRAEAKEALRSLGADGGTTIGAWLRLAGQLLREEHPGVIRHVLLLTDGRNQHESSAELAAALRDCEELFTCDCRGVGTDWSVAELRTISSALHGTVELVVDPADLAKDFQDVMYQAMRKAVAEVHLRLWTPEGATVRLVKQTAPTLVDLSARRVDSGPLTGDYPTGSWGPESRDYHLCIELEPGGVGEEKLACRATFVHGTDATQQPLPQTFSHTEPDGSTNDFVHARVRALWTDDLGQATVINDKVAVVTGRAELAKAVQDGLAAHQRGDSDFAVDRFSQARTLAEQVQDEHLLAQLDQIYDPGTGTFRLDRMRTQDEMRLDIESTKTTLLRRG